MKRLIAPLLLLLAGVVAAETATQPTTRPDAEKYAAPNPDVEAIIKRVPTHLLPNTKAKPEENIPRNKQMREWDKANVDGKMFRAKVFKWGAVGARFYLPDGSRVNVIGNEVVAALANFKDGAPAMIEGKIGRGGLLSHIDNEHLTYSFALVSDVRATAE